MRAWIGSLTFVFAIACGDSAPRREIIQPTAPSNDEQQVEQSRSGLADMTLISSDCNREGSVELTTSGSIRIEGDEIYVKVSNMPELSGLIVDGNAAIKGETTFPGSNETITCSVEGTASIESTIVIAQVTETLTSPSELNCAEKWSVTVHR